MAMIPCPECKKPISETATACQKCGAAISPEYLDAQKKRMAKRKKLAPLVFLVTFIVFGAILFGSFSNNGASATTDSAASALELVSTDYHAGEYSSTIVGTVKNNSTKTYSYVQVEINLYDAAGAQIGSTMANVNNLEGGGTWHFEAMVLEDKVASYKVKGITGF